jgi:hypothetical protein
MSVQDAALKLKRWAVENRLLRRGRDDRAPPTAPPLIFEEEANKAANAVLRAKPITFLGCNRPDETIVVYLRARPSRADERKLPKEVDGYRVVYKKGQAAVWNGKVSTSVSDPYKLIDPDRYTCGSSISLANRVSAGTLGCLVRNENAVMFGLTNNHVTGSCNHTELGFPVMAPGLADAGPASINPFTVGRHFDCAPMLDGLPENVDAIGNTDAALFSLIDPDRFSSSQRGSYDTPAVVGDLTESTWVMKAGRTTGITKGKVTAVAADYDAIEYEIPEINLRKMVYYGDLFSIEGTNQPFADMGDSGSLIIEVDGPDCPKSVGIVVGVATDLTYALAIPLKSVLEYFKVNIVAGFNL